MTTARQFAIKTVASFDGDQKSAACRHTLARALKKHFNLSMLCAMTHYNCVRQLMRTWPDQRGFFISSERLM